MSPKRKPMTVADISATGEGGVAEPHTDVEVSAPEKASGQRAHVKQLTLYLPHPVYRQLRELAFHEEKRMHGLVMEGLDRLFEDRGRPSVKQLTRIT